MIEVTNPTCFEPAAATINARVHTLAMVSFEFKADVINLVTPWTSSKLGPEPIIVNPLQGVTSSSARVTQLRHAGSVTMVT